MSITRTFALLALTFAFVGCAYEHRSGSPPPQAWSRSLSDEEISRCKQVACDAAESPELWKRFKPNRITTEPVKLDTRGIQYYLDQEQFDRVDVAIPSGGFVVWHACYIGVTVARGTYEVLDMYESFWP